jgi:hypothetical protein
VRSSAPRQLSFVGIISYALEVVIAWSRAHQPPAADVTDPAEIDIFGIATKAAGTLSPIP